MRKKKLLLLNFFLLQTFLFSLIMYNEYFRNFGDVFYMHPAIILIFVVIIVVLSFFIVRELVKAVEKEKQEEIMQVKYQEATKTIDALKSKKHDFVNHLQVISGLIQMNKSDDALDYIKKLSQDLKQVDKIVKIDRPEVAALLSTKLASAEGVQVVLDINSSLSHLNIASDKIVSILSNLLDNAIYQAGQEEEQWVRVRIDEERDWYLFRITNPGVIPSQLKEKIFNPGVTTKGEHGTGMGLYIVNKLVGECGGTVSFTSEEREGTTFVIRLPRYKQ